MSTDPAENVSKKVRPSPPPPPAVVVEVDWEQGQFNFSSERSSMLMSTPFGENSEERESLKKLFKAYLAADIEQKIKGLEGERDALDAPIAKLKAILQQNDDEQRRLDVYEGKKSGKQKEIERWRKKLPAEQLSEKPNLKGIEELLQDLITKNKTARVWLSHRMIERKTLACTVIFKEMDATPINVELNCVDFKVEIERKKGHIVIRGKSQKEKSAADSFLDARAKEYSDSEGVSKNIAIAGFAIGGVGALGLAGLVVCTAIASTVAAAVSNPLFAVALTLAVLGTIVAASAGVGMLYFGEKKKNFLEAKNLPLTQRRRTIFEKPQELPKPSGQVPGRAFGSEKNHE